MQSLPFATRSNRFTYDLRDLAAIIVSLNIALMVWFHFGDRWSPTSRLCAIFSLGIADLFFAPLLWSAHQNRFPRLLAPLRIPAVGLMCLIPIAPLIAVRPQGIYHTIEPDSAFNKLFDSAYYQALLDPSDQALYLTSEVDSISRFNPVDGELLVSQSERFYEVQGLALDAPSRRLIGATTDFKTLVLDADSLEILDLLPHSYLPPRDLNNWTFNKFRMIWDAPRRILIASSDIFQVRLCPDARTVIAVYYMGTRRAAQLDPARDELHMILTSELVSLNTDTLEVVRRLNLGMIPARLALDAVADCIYVTQPISGSLIKVDLNTYKVIQEIRSFPGVRVAAVDHKRRWLIAAGFSPLLEVYSLDDYSLIARITAPTWARWIAVDEQRGKAYITFLPSGLWELDLNALEARSKRLSWQRIDPFYTLLSLLDHELIVPRIITTTQSDVVEDHQPLTRLIDPGQCPQGDWTIDAD
ncbi:MAG: hypothetical protein P9M14_10400 [Candidatus Alcyoniella australis]|nr:hypothetical protein [Candidatus Alcyoniella australis]